MGFFDLFKTKPAAVLPPPAAVQTLEVIPQDPQQFIYPVLNDYRKGMWVQTPSHRTGILAKFLDNGMAEVSLTDAKGLNVGSEEHMIAHLARAKISEMPADRIQHLSRNELRALGYED